MKFYKVINSLFRNMWGFFLIYKKIVLKQIQNGPFEVAAHAHFAHNAPGIAARAHFDINFILYSFWIFFSRIIRSSAIKQTLSTTLPEVRSTLLQNVSRSKIISSINFLYSCSLMPPFIPQILTSWNREEIFT